MSQIEESRNRLRNIGEEIFFMMSKYLDKENAEMAIADVLRYTLNSNKKIHGHLIDTSQKVINGRPKNKDDFSDTYNLGLSDALKTRIKTHQALISEINNDISVIPYL